MRLNLSFRTRGGASDASPPWRTGTGAVELASLRATRDERLARLDARLVADGLTASSADPLDTVAALDRWTRVAWPRTLRADDAEPSRFRAAAWAPPRRAALYAQVVDVGVMLGEAVRRLRPGWDWGLDTFDDHVADGVASAGRVVVRDLGLPDDNRAPVACDTIDIAFVRCQALAWRDARFETFLAALRPALWETHRRLYVGPDRGVD